MTEFEKCRDFAPARGRVNSDRETDAKARDLGRLHGRAHSDDDPVVTGRDPGRKENCARDAEATHAVDPDPEEIKGEDDARIIAEFIQMHHARGLVLPYCEYQIIDRWLKLATSTDVLMLYLSDLVPEFVAKLPEGAPPFRLSQIDAKVRQFLRDQVDQKGLRTSGEWDG
jgi:hypothetical protein